MATTAIQPVPAHELHVDSPRELPKLRSNYGKYLDPSSIGRMRPTLVDTPIDEIRRRFDQDGYVWVKGVIPREDVLDLRQHYFEHISSTNILDPTQPARLGIFNPSEDPLLHAGIGATELPASQHQQHLLTTAHASPIYRAFLAHPKLRTFIRTLMGWQQEKMVLRNMLRHNVPGGLSTGIHYDRLFLRAGEDEFLTAWIPIGDVAANGGGLTYLEGSDPLGREIENGFLEGSKKMTPEERVSAFNVAMNRDGQLAHDVEAWGREVEGQYRKAFEEHAHDIHAGGGAAGKDWTYALTNARSTTRRSGGGKLRWLVADYEAGDVVFHSPYMCHASCKNEDEQRRIRLASDVRFYEEGAKCDERWSRDLWKPDDGL